MNYNIETCTDGIILQVSNGLDNKDSYKKIFLKEPSKTGGADKALKDLFYFLEEEFEGDMGDETIAWITNEN